MPQWLKLSVHNMHYRSVLNNLQMSFCGFSRIQHFERSREQLQLICCGYFVSKANILTGARATRGSGLLKASTTNILRVEHGQIRSAEPFDEMAKGLESAEEAKVRNEGARS